MQKTVSIVGVLLLFLGLILIRVYEHSLFYDPLLVYFKGDHLTKSLPVLEPFKLFVSYFFRYGLNSLISLFILKLSFPRNTFLKTISLFYGMAFLILFTVFFTLIIFDIDTGNLILFYIRRFIIQPVFVILLFPLLYLLKKGYSFNDE